MVNLLLASDQVTRLAFHTRAAKKQLRRNPGAGCAPHNARASTSELVQDQPPKNKIKRETLDPRFRKIIDQPTEPGARQMIDIRELICTAERLESKGLKRRAAEAWRRIAVHPEAPEELKEKFWRCVDAENKCRRTDSDKDSRQHANRPNRNAEKQQAREMLKAGRSRQAVAKALGVSLSFVYAAAPVNAERA